MVVVVTDVDFIRYSSSIRYEIDVIKKKTMTANNKLPLFEALQLCAI